MANVQSSIYNIPGTVPYGQPVTNNTYNKVTSTTPKNTYFSTTTPAKSTAINNVATGTKTSSTPTYLSGGGSSNANQLTSLKSQQQNLQGQITSAQNAGYGANPTTPITYGSNGLINSYSSTQNQNQQQPQDQGLLNQYTQKLGNYSDQNNVAVTQAQGILTSALAKRDKLKADIASQYGGIENSGIPLEFQQGREQALSRQYASQLDAAEQEVTGAQSAINAAMTARGQDVNALQSATTASYPSNSQYQMSPTQTSYSSNNQPVSGLMSSQGQQNTNSQLSDLADKVISANKGAGGISYNDAYTQLQGLYGGYVANQLLGAITAKDPSFNVNSNTGISSAQQSNAQTGGTAGTQAANTGYQQAVQDYTNMTATNSSAESQINQVRNILSQTGLNQGVPDYTKAVNILQTKLGGDGYTKLLTAMTELQNFYSRLLASGGTTPSGSENQAISVLNPNSSASQINASIEQLQSAAYNRMKAQYDKMATFQTNLGGGNTNSSSNGNTINPYH